MRYLIAIVLVACSGDRPYEPQRRGPLVLDDAPLYVDDAAPAAIIVDAGKRAGLDRRGRERVVMLAPVGEQLLVLAGKSGRLEVVDVGLPFDALDVSPDGRYGIAYQPEDEGPSRSLFAFPNAVAVIDFLARPLSA